MLNHCSVCDLHTSSVRAPKKEGARDCFDKKGSPLVSVFSSSPLHSPFDPLALAEQTQSARNAELAMND